jgi:hypothetical protein
MRAPGRLVGFVGLIAPRDPFLPLTPSKELQKRPSTACFNDLALFIGLSRMLALPAFQVIYLPAAGLQGSRILPPVPNRMSSVTLRK